MSEKLKNQSVVGTWFAILAFGIWGFLPVFWKLLKAVSAYETVAHRVVWTCLFTALLLIVQRKWQVLKKIITDRDKLWPIGLCAALLAINWLTFIYAVNNNHVLDASLGYYINPLISVFLGLVVLKERVNRWQKLAIALAFLAVAVLTYQYGRIPWIALTLAVTFGLYGLIKKTGHVDAIVGLTLETLFMVPVALGYILVTTVSGSGVLTSGSLATPMLLISTGVVTAVPLLFFAGAAQRIPLSRVGFIQYLTPSCFFLLGRFVYHETFSSLHLVSFIFIWMALVIYSLSSRFPLKRREITP